MNIIDQLAADRADQESRINDKRRMAGGRRYSTTTLNRAASELKDLAYEEPQWTRADLIKLVDLAIAEAAEFAAQEERDAAEDAANG